MGGLLSAEPVTKRQHCDVWEYEAHRLPSIVPPEGFKRISDGSLVWDSDYLRSSRSERASRNDYTTNRTSTLPNNPTINTSTVQNNPTINTSARFCEPTVNTSPSSYRVTENNNSQINQSTPSSNASGTSSTYRGSHLENTERITSFSRNHILQQILPSFVNSPSILTYVSLNDPIYRQIRKNSNAFYRPKRILTVVSITQVKNPYLEAMYNLKKADLKNTYGEFVVEKNLFHGATAEKINSICQQNFNYRLCGTNRGYKYGHGISFSPKFTYANYFCDKTTRVRTMLKCKVLFVRAHIGDADTIVPCEGYDTTMRDNGKVIVKYDDDVFYPEYVIKFTLT